MNKSFIRNGNNTFLVSIDSGNQITYKANVGTSNDTVNEILTTENEIEALESDLWDLKCQESDVRIKNQIAKGIYFGLLPVLLLVTSCVEVYYGADLLSVLGIGATATGITTLYNISMTGTFAGRKHKTKEINAEIKATKDVLEELRNNIDKLKTNTNFKEVTNSAVKQIEPIDRTYEEELSKPLTKKLTK